MTDDLITDLSRISGLFVISRNSSFFYMWGRMRRWLREGGAIDDDQELGRTSRVQIPVKTNCTPTQASRNPITRVRAGR